jgi:hypothetical protein
MRRGDSVKQNLMFTEFWKMAIGKQKPSREKRIDRCLVWLLKNF